MASSKNEIFFIPEYMSKFKCIGKDCIDSCCIGWNIEIDKKTYQKYKKSSNKIISSISQKYLIKKKTNSDIAYAKMENRVNNSCPLLTDTKLCSAYNLLGKKSLSTGCSTYPRIIKKFKEIGFISGEFSCPEVAKLCLSKPDIKIKKVKRNKLNNIFNSNNIHLFEIPKNLPENLIVFFKSVIDKLSNKNTFYDSLEEIIISFYKIHNKGIQILSDEEKKKIKEKDLLIKLNFLPKIFFTSSKVDSRYQKICKSAEEKSKYFNISETEFKRKYINIYEHKFNKFKHENNYIFKKFFVNEFIKNIEKFETLTNEFDDFIREILCLLNLTNFLVICQLFESEKELTTNDYIDVISAVTKQIQSSREKSKLIINFFKKLDCDNLHRRLLDVY